MRRSCVATTACILLFALGAPARAQTGLRAYIGLVASYAAGDRNGAIRTLARWPEDDVRTVVTLFISQGETRVRAAAMLHTDIAADAEARGSLGLFHLQQGRRLLNASRPKTTSTATTTDPFVCGWYSLASSIVIARGAVPSSADYATEGMAVCPKDPVIRLWAGIMADSAGTTIRPAGFQSPATLGATPIMGRQQSLRMELPSTPSDTVGVRAAEKAYRGALAIDPAFLDARLRLGELLDRDGRHDDGARELAAVIAGSNEPPLVYLAHLFAGRAQERAGDLRAAAVEYEAAREVGPGCQSAYTALAFVEERLGNRAKARDLAAAFVNLPDERKAVDPWWTFRGGGGVNVELLESLRQAAE